MSNSLLVAVCVAALPLTSLQAQTIVTTRANCLESFLSDPGCWTNNTSPVSTPSTIYAIDGGIDGGVPTDIIFNLPNTLEYIDSRALNLRVHEDLTVRTSINVNNIVLEPLPGNDESVDLIIGSPENSGLFAESITLMPGTSLTYIEIEDPIYGKPVYFGQDLSDPAGAPARLTYIAPTVRLNYVSRNLQHAIIDIPTATSLRIYARLGEAPITINAPETLSAGDLNILGNHPDFQFNAPKLATVGNMFYTIGPGPQVFLNSPPFDVIENVEIEPIDNRIEPLVFPELQTVGRLWIRPNSPLITTMSFPNLTEAEHITIGRSPGSHVFPELLRFNRLYLNDPARNDNPAAAPSSIVMPLADIGNNPIRVLIRSTERGSIGSVDLRSLSSLPSESSLWLPRDSAPRFDNLHGKLDRSSVWIDAPLPFPMGPFTSLDYTVLIIQDQGYVTVEDPEISASDLTMYGAGPGATLQFNGTRSISTTNDQMAWSVIGGTINMPDLESLSTTDSRLDFILDIGGSNSSVYLPNLQTIQENTRLEVHRAASIRYLDNQVNFPNTGGHDLVIGGDFSAIAFDPNFQGRLAMSDQSALTSAHRLSAQALEMPAVTSITGSEIALQSYSGLPFTADFSAASSVSNAAFITTGPGTINIPAIGQSNDITIAGGPVRFTGNVTTSNITGSGTVQFEGNFLPPSNNTGFPDTIEMIGSGDRSISPLRGDVGPDAARARRGLVVGGPGATTRLHLVPRPNSDFEGAFYLGKFTDLATGFRIRNGSTLFLNDVPAYLWQYDPETDSEHYVPLTSLIPTGSRCVEFDGGLLCRRECLPDLNNDNVADNGDIGRFVELFLANDPAADINADGVTDFSDIQTFVAAFLAGC